MRSDFDVRENLAAFVAVGATESVGAALTRLRRDGGEFVLITASPNVPEEDQPVCVLREVELIVLARDESQDLSQLLEKCPQLLVLGERDLSDEEAPREVLSVLAEAGASGCVIRLADGALGVVSADSIARAVSSEDIALVRVGMAEAAVPARTYICRKCVPPRRKRPRIGSAPNCDVWSHGVMQAA